MIIYPYDVMVALDQRMKSAGSRLLLPRLPKRRPRLVAWWVWIDGASLERQSESKSTDYLLNYINYHIDLISRNYKFSHRFACYTRKHHTRNTTPAHQHSLHRT